MKSAEIEVGGEYVIALRPKHVLIPGTDVTYQERYEALLAMLPDGPHRIPANVPEAARRELRRLRGALGVGLGGGLRSRFIRCRHLDREGTFRNGEIVVTQKAGIGLWDSFLDRISVIATVSEALGNQRYRVEADFIEEQGSMSLADFDPTVPERIPDDDVAEEPEKEDYDDQASYEVALAAWEAEVDAWWELHHNGLHDYAGTLEAVVHRAAFLYPWEDGLVERLNEQERREQEERQARWAAGTKEREQRRLEKRGGEIVDDVIARILADDDWEALA